MRVPHNDSGVALVDQQVTSSQDRLSLCPAELDERM
jgi:hypothetical protein